MHEGAGQSTRDTRLPIGGKQRINPGQGGGVRRVSDAEVSSTECMSPRLNLRRSTRVCACKVMSLFKVRDKRIGQRDSHQRQQFAELRRLGVYKTHTAGFSSSAMGKAALGDTSARAS